MHYETILNYFHHCIRPFQKINFHFYASIDSKVKFNIRDLKQRWLIMPKMLRLRLKLKLTPLKIND